MTPPTLIPRPPSVPLGAPATATAWIGGYREAVCACTTRGCVRDLQARFIEKLVNMTYDESRDGQSFAEASRAAIRCYAALPESS